MFHPFQPAAARRAAGTVLSIPPPPRSVKGCFCKKPRRRATAAAGAVFSPGCAFFSAFRHFCFPCFGSRTCHASNLLFFFGADFPAVGFPFSGAGTGSGLFSPVLLSLPVPAFFPALLSLQAPPLWARRTPLRAPRLFASSAFFTAGLRAAFAASFPPWQARLFLPPRSSRQSFWPPAFSPLLLP